MRGDLRARTAAALDTLCAPTGVLHAAGARASFRLYADDARRRLTKDRIVEAYLAEQSDIIREGRCAVVTAGVPGSGKSTAMRERGLAEHGWRILDADRIKDHLIREALTAGIYDDLLALQLPDEKPLRPRELATLVHRESTELLDRVQEHCVRAGENIVIEGTFRWDGLAAQLWRELAAGGYTDVTILGVEVSCATACERALDRWWTGRTDPDDELGGRFTPTAAITSLFPDSNGWSVCGRNARTALEHPLAREIESMTLIVDDYTSGDHVEHTTTAHHGMVNYTS